MTDSARIAVLFGLSLPAVGCALFAVQPPTPASHISPAELAALEPQPGVRHYLIVFGSDKPSRNPAYTHTWATLVTTTDVPGGPPRVGEETISWLPVEMPIQALSRKTVPGRNYGLHETMRAMLDTKQDVALWGPYEVWHRFAYRFRVQKSFMESGAVGYQCIDSWGEAGRTGAGCDCIHSITDMDPEISRVGYPLFLYGQPASARLVRRVMNSPAPIDPLTTHDWLLPQLALKQYPIDVCTYRGPVAGHCRR
ncbi:hypothetical protein [Urbifossiella limnaea]|uniref:Lipoprotein n=1 Tax=Urbifossiella limnaea TaxID=2528023 RepID=A0A517XVX4_9BACT|nr:hypothetical protein [Urbifossiella limnaea]QDU21660.1 hypothetical protein ETAA1_36310 [Urbifossiella limnaea]